MDTQFLDELTYRKARLSDVEAVAPLVNTLAGEASDEEVRRRLKRMMFRPSYHVLVAAHSGKIVGLNILREGLFLGADAPGLQSLSLVVDSGYRGKGIATYLLERALEKSAKEGFCQLWGLTQHEHLHEFYQNLGFENTGVRFVIQTPSTGRLPVKRRLVRRLGV